MNRRLHSLLISSVNWLFEWVPVRHDLICPDGQLLNRTRYTMGKPLGKDLHWHDLQNLELLHELDIDHPELYAWSREVVDLAMKNRWGDQAAIRVTLSAHEYEFRRRVFTWIPFGGRIESYIWCETDHQFDFINRPHWTIPWDRQNDPSPTRAFLWWYKSCSKM